MIRQLENLIAEYKKLQPISEETQKKLDQKFRLEFNYNSNHLEGNTLTYGETKLLLIFDQVKSNHEMRELEEMKAHDVALAMIKHEAADKDKPLTERFIKELNQTILVQDFWKDAITADGQNTRRKIKVGQYKEYPNSVIQSNGEVFEYASPQETPILMGELVDWYNLEVEKGELTAIQLAALLHYRYIRIHPFDDGNGRVARLLVNYVLFRYDLPPVIIKTDDKKNYLRALQQADSGDLNAFVDYMVNQLAWSVDISIKASKGESIEKQNDWEKQLSLLKKGLGDKNDIVLKRSDAIIESMFNNTIKQFVELYENMISKFDNLFMSRTSFFLINGDDMISNDLKNSLKKTYEHISQYKDIWFSIEQLQSINLRSLLTNYRRPFQITRVKALEVFFVFEENAYRIHYGENLESKLYNELLTEEEMNEIISYIAKDLLQQIETLTKE